MAREITSLMEGALKGLAPTKVLSRDLAFAVELENLYPKEGSLQALPSRGSLDDVEVAFGFPQVFVGKDKVILCDEDAIYDYNVDTGVATEIDVYSSVPGTDVVTNGDFLTDTVWTKTDWTIAGGLATPNDDSGSITQECLTVGKVYLVKTKIVGETEVGYLQVSAGSTLGRYHQNAGTYVEIIKCTTTDVLKVANTGLCTLSVDSISAKELPVLPTFEANDRWEFAEYHSHFLLCDGKYIFYYLPGVGLIRLTSEAESVRVARNRLIIAGNDLQPSLTFDAKYIGSSTHSDTCSIWWSSLNFTDVALRLLPTFSDYSIADFELFMDQMQMNTGGSVNLHLKNGDTILQIEPFMEGFLAYCARSIWLFSEVSDPISTYKIDKIADFGIAKRGAAGGTWQEQLFLSTEGDLWRVTSKGLENLGYRYYLEDMLDSAVWIEVDAENQLFYIVYSSGSYVLSAEGLSFTNERPNSISIYGDLSTSVDSASYKLETPWLTLGSLAQKSILELRIDVSTPSSWTAKVQTRSSPAATIRSKEATFDSDGRLLVSLSGIEVKVSLSSTAAPPIHNLQLIWAEGEGIFK